MDLIAPLLPISPAQRFIEGSLTGSTLHHSGHRAAGQDDAPPGHQCRMGVVSDNQHQFVFLLKQAQGPLLVDARIFDLVNKDNRAVADQSNVRDHQCP